MTQSSFKIPPEMHTLSRSSTPTVPECLHKALTVSEFQALMDQIREVGGGKKGGHRSCHDQPACYPSGQTEQHPVPTLGSL